MIEILALAIGLINLGLLVIVNSEHKKRLTELEERMKKALPRSRR